MWFKKHLLGTKNSEFPVSQLANLTYVYAAVNWTWLTHRIYKGNMITHRIHQGNVTRIATSADRPTIELDFTISIPQS